MSKKCPVCDETDQSEFYELCRTRYCKKCYNSRMREANKRGVDRNIAEKKKRGKCLNCPLVVSDTNTHHFEWDHRDQSQKLKMICLMNRSPTKKFDEEIAKCDLLCLFCHRDKTIIQQRGGGPGRPTGWRKKTDSFCNVCNRDYKSNTGLKLHEKSKKHIRMTLI